MPDANAPNLVGIAIGTTSGGLRLTLAEHGTMVTAAWYGSVTGGPGQIGVVEGMDHGYCDD